MRELIATVVILVGGAWMFGGANAALAMWGVWTICFMAAVALSPRFADLVAWWIHARARAVRQARIVFRKTMEEPPEAPWAEL